MDPERAECIYADVQNMAKLGKPQWPPVAAGHHFCVVVADAAWQTGRVAKAVMMKFLRPLPCWRGHIQYQKKD